MYYIVIPDLDNFYFTSGTKYNLKFNTYPQVEFEKIPSNRLDLKLEVFGTLKSNSSVNKQKRNLILKKRENGKTKILILQIK